MANQIEDIIDMLSINRAGSKLKNISIKHSPHQENHSLITFIFEGDEKEERHIGIYGEDISVSFGSVVS